jgi:tetratricopeptide (TPR) repeat protein
MILLLLEMLLPDRTREAKTARPPAAGLTAGAAKVAALALLLCTLPRSGLASPASALHDYNAGNYTNALAEYERLAETGTNDARLVFNAGAAAYRATNFDEAARLFSEVTAAPDLKLQQRAYYNLGNTQFRQGELKFEPDSGNLDAMEETWKDSLKSYARAVDLNTNDADAVFNQLFVKRQLAYIGQLREAMRRAKQSADEAVRRNAYHQALEIMESLNQTLNSPLAAKKYQDYIKKLKDIDAIATPPHQP